MKAKKIIALLISAVLALSLFAVMTGCADKESVVGAWKSTDSGDDMYVVYDEDGTCKMIGYMEDADVFPDGVYFCIEGTWEEVENGDLEVEIDILGETTSGEESKANYFGDDATYEAIDAKDVPSDFYTLDELIDEMMDYVVDSYEDAGLTLSDEDYDALREQLVDTMIDSMDL